MLRAITAASLLAALAPWSAAGAVEDQDLKTAVRQLGTGDWNTRIRTVHEVEYMQEDGIPALALAAEDGDWQVRMAAVHALAPLGDKSTPMLKAILRNEPCPVVRLIALHDLGSKVAEVVEEKEIGWFFSATNDQVNACQDQPQPGRAPWAAGLEISAPPTAGQRPARRRAVAHPPKPELPESHEKVVTADVPRPQAAVAAAPAAEVPPAPPTKSERYAELDALLAEPAPVPGKARGVSSDTSGTLPTAPRRGAGTASVIGRRNGPAETLPKPVVPAAAPEKPVAAPASFETTDGKAPHDALPDLVLELKKGSPASRARAADELGALRGAAAAAVPALLGALKDKSPRVRASASLALGNIGAEDPTVVPRLEKALKDKNMDVRYAAALALSRAGTPEARAAFKKSLNADGRREIDQ